MENTHENSITEFRYSAFFLSNFSAYPFIYKNIYFKNSEQAYQWEKAENDNDKQLILNCTTAKESKLIGHKIKCNIQKWDENKVNIMEQILRHKFIGNLKLKLIETGNKKLIEGNYWHDNFWGDCYCYKCKNKEGQNNLGKILMKLRNEFKN
jgi:ribA/ribD-fused uncharacterized protein